jgi:hypothetical protein
MDSLTRRALFSLATSERFERAVRSVPGGEPMAYRLASRYVAGLTADDALATAAEMAVRGVRGSIDFFGENVTDPDEADRVADEYVRLAGRLVEASPGTFLSLDLSHLDLDGSAVAVARRLERIAGALPEGARVQVGAEEAARRQRWPRTTRCSGRRCCRRCRGSRSKCCWVCGRTIRPRLSRAGSRYACTWHSATGGSATRCAGLPSRGDRARATRLGIGRDRKLGDRWPHATRPSSRWRRRR